MVRFFEWISMRAIRVLVPSILVVAALAVGPTSALGGRVTSRSAAVVAAGPTSAQAGRFHVYSCRTPSGESAPVDGWSGSAVGPESYAHNTCGQPGGALIAALGDQVSRTANADSGIWTLKSPAGVTVVATRLWRAGDTKGGAEFNAGYQFTFAGPAGKPYFDQCSFVGECVSKGEIGDPFATINNVAVPGSALGTPLTMTATCGGTINYPCPTGKGDANGYAAVVYLYAADITLEQTAGPTASNVGGELAGAPTVTGRSALTFNASDPGAGVYEAVFSVDGQVVQRTVVDEAGGRCRDVGQTMDGTPAFLYLQPCPGSVGADVALDTTRVANGTHRLTVSVIDAAGNGAAVLDRVVTFYNPPPLGIPGPPNGANASAQAKLSVRWKRTRKPSLTSAFDSRQTITGRLTGPGGVPISAAQIDVQATPSTGGPTLSMLGPRTGRDGRFKMRLPRGISSRTLHFAYREHVGDLIPVATGALTLTVKAGLTLSITPRTAGVGQSIFFKGHLRGHPIPASGKQLVLEARSPGGAWIEFKVVRSDLKGHYRASYRFKFPGPALYQFRVVCEPESDYPFAGGSSRVLAVHER
jgi:hypothetical protein